MRAVLVSLLLLLISPDARAHLGIPDVFYAGNAGPYNASVTIRMPTVVRGRAEISVRLPNGEPVTVSFLPLFSRTAVSNAPPPDLGRLVRGETNLYTGELWLMRSGAYSILVKINGPAGEGAVEIPINSVAFKLLPMSPVLGKILAALGAVIFFGVIAVVIGAAREATLPPGELPQSRQKWMSALAGPIALVVMTSLLIQGRHWWNREESVFRTNLRTGGWPDLAASVQVEGAQRILKLDIGQRDYTVSETLPLVPDHGKLMHLFMVREGAKDVFAHLHPIRSGKKTFQAVLPPLPEGRYQLFCDVTLENSSMSSTATNTVTLPPLPGQNSPTNDSLEPDEDDSWAVYSKLTEGSATNPVFQLPNGLQVSWENHAPLVARRDAGLRFDVRDASGRPVLLEPYLGMASHAAVLRNDGAVFDHLHPMGNFSMAAQQVFATKLAKETGVSTNLFCGLPYGTNALSSGTTTNPSVISLPYEFPEPGKYRIWVQFKVAEKIDTAVFDAQVESPRMTTQGQLVTTR